MHRHQLQQIVRFVLAGVLVTGAAMARPSMGWAQQLVFVVRHAERADAGGSVMTGATDPPLSAAGHTRADKLAGILSSAGIAGIYVTEYQRTRQTAAPLAAALKLTPVVMAAGDSVALVARIKATHPHDIVLIVGHANTVPEIVAAFGGPKVTVADDEYDKLFVVVPGTGTVATIKY